MPEKQTKRQRIDEARETARISREKREKRQKLLKWLVPTSVTVAILLIAALVTTLIVVNQPAPSFPNGPKNMASDGIVFTGDSGSMAPVETPATKKGADPTPTKWAADDTRPHVVTFIDWACPVCKQFEEAYGSAIQDAVSQDLMTLEIRPIAIVDRAYLSSRYSSRVNNAAACVANFSPDDFYAVQTSIYTNQPEEQTNGLTNAEIWALVKAAGADSPDIETCITNEQFKDWVAATTQRQLAEDSDMPVTGTPTVYVDGKQVDFQQGFAEFLTGLGATPSEG